MAKKWSASKKENQYVRFTQWIVEQLRKSGVASKAEFVNSIRSGGPGGDNGHWSRASDSVRTVLKSLGVNVELIGAGDQAALELKGPFQPNHYATAHFDPNADFEKKQRIGRLVAGFLKKTGNSVVLGTGSTVYHVGLQMRELVEKLDREEPLADEFGIEPADSNQGSHQYKQNFWTVNIPLASDWCEGDTKPVDHVSVPEGVLRTKSFRFGSKVAPQWAAAIAVVGADGCYYDPETKRAWLYGNSDEVAGNTNLFLSKATDIVICCLTSSKLIYNKDRGQNSGPLIEAGDRHPIRKYLVTDRRITAPTRKGRKTDVSEEFTGDLAIKALEAANWITVTEPDDWNKGV